MDTLATGVLTDDTEYWKKKCIASQFFAQFLTVFSFFDSYLAVAFQNQGS